MGRMLQMQNALKTLGKLLHWYIIGSSLNNACMHTYRTRMLPQMALSQVNGKAEYASKSEEILLAAFLYIDGALDNTSSKSCPRCHGTL